MTACPCASCGAAPDTTRIDFRFARPDAATRADPGRDTLLRARGVGDFVRVMLPVRLAGDVVVTFGTWLCVTPQDLARVAAARDTPAYAGLVVEGTLANAIQPWGDVVLGAPVRAEVHDTGQMPYVNASDDPDLKQILTGEWDRDDVLGCFADPLPVAIRARVSADWTVARAEGFTARPSKQTLRLATPGRTVILEPGDVPAGKSGDEWLATLLKGAPDPAGEAREDTPGEIRYAFWLSSARQHELYGFVIRDAAFLQITVIHDDPGHHDWAVGAWRSARYQPL